MNTIRTLITCAQGLGHAAAIEIERFLGQVEQVRPSGVMARFSLVDFYRFCLGTQVASRILLPLYQEPLAVHDGQAISDAVYAAARRAQFSQYFDIDTAFWLRLKLDDNIQANQNFCTLRLKDGVVDDFYAQMGARPDADKNADFIIYAHIGDEIAFYQDISKTSLHARGYRVAPTTAPLKENLAAGLLYLAGWHTGQFDAIFDPMCGSGTFLIEALLMDSHALVHDGHDFGFDVWRGHDADILAKAREQAWADTRQSQALAVGFDGDVLAVNASIQNAQAAGVSLDVCHVPLHQMSLPQALHGKKTLTITNPPYGERLGRADMILPLYQGLAARLRQVGMLGKLAVLAADITHADALALQDAATHRLKNGAIKVFFRTGILTDKPDILQKSIEKISHAPQDLTDRLYKNIKKVQKMGLSCARIYDADLPQYNAAVDVYGKKVHIQEYAAPKTIDADTAKSRLMACTQAVRAILSLDKQDVFLKKRERQSGSNQYTRQKRTNMRQIVSENGAFYYVNLADYLDTGLFLDHRLMRARLKQACDGNTRALNLFAYTCTASVQMALGGAFVVSVDLSANYLTWGAQNFALNGLDIDEHDFIEADAFLWLKECTDKFDVIFIDPPTFSNSKKFFGTFDIMRDHVALISRAMNRLNTDGVLYFSNNFSKFVLDDEIMARFDVQNITNSTTSADFKPIHHSFKICHKALVGDTSAQTDHSKDQTATRKDWRTEQDKRTKIRDKPRDNTQKDKAHAQKSHAGKSHGERFERRDEHQRGGYQRAERGYFHKNAKNRQHDARTTTPKQPKKLITVRLVDGKKVIEEEILD